MRNSRARLDYGVSASASQYGDYGESVRLGRGSQLGYGGSSARQDSYGLYDGHQSRVGSGYGGSKTYGSLGGSEAGGTYSSYGNDYLSSGADIGGGSYSSMYSSRSMGSGYLPGSGSGSYY
nr:unknown [Picea sitchensis]